ncbi:CYTH domain-containing protein [Halalkalibacter krulwichiae]|uniref:CYTH domain protein n=1 Tax=Halalkalibacter krulwichiae TaxID=199441 RepID=A0A1X9MFN4_9BACI|nr:CYTH domain-containing protein [Halalkalibacter krulwichiae]ARK31454.1 CYTH domain protein [Halalkalibacter krulwichiae]
MSQEIEIEVKSMLTEAGFFQLLKHFNLKEEEAIIQHNHYFETATFSLKEKGAGLRIREKQGIFTLTLKQPHKVGKLETHQSLSFESWLQAKEEGLLPNGEVMKQLQQLDIPVVQLQYQGTLSTSRIEMPYNEGVLCFDKSSYFDKIDFEIEYEGQSEQHANTTLLNILSQVNLTPTSTENKVRRFFSEKLKVDKSSF